MQGRLMIIRFLAALLLPVLFAAAGCAVYSRTITSDPPGAVLYSGSTPGSMGLVLGKQTPVVFNDVSWLPYCFRVAKSGYADSDTKCLSGGIENQSLHFTLSSESSAPVDVARPSSKSAGTKHSEGTAKAIATGGSRWKVQRVVDSMTDRVTCVAYYKGDPNIQLTTTSLGIRYRGRGGVSMVTWRLDDGEPQRRLASDVEQHIGAVLWEGGTLSSMLAARRLRVQTLTVLSTIAEDDIDLTGVGGVVSELAACQ